MITAKDARKITDKNVQSIKSTFLYRADAAIQEAAKKGESWARLEIPPSASNYMGEIIEDLQTVGYKVRRDCHSDFRESWDNLIINW